VLGLLAGGACPPALTALSARVYVPTMSAPTSSELRAQAMYAPPEKRVELLAQAAYSGSINASVQSPVASPSAAAAPDEADEPSPPPPPPVDFDENDDFDFHGWTPPSETDGPTAGTMVDNMHRLRALMRSGKAQYVLAAQQAIISKDGRDTVATRQRDWLEALRQDLESQGAPLSDEQWDKALDSQPPQRPREWLGRTIPVTLDSIDLKVNEGCWVAQCKLYKHNLLSILADLVETHYLSNSRGQFGPIDVVNGCGCSEDYFSTAFVQNIMANFRARRGIADDVVVVPVQFGSDKSVLLSASVYPFRVRLMLPGVQMNNPYMLAAMLPLGSHFLITDSSDPMLKPSRITMLATDVASKLTKAMLRAAMNNLIECFERTADQPVLLRVDSSGQRRRFCFCFGLYSCDAEERYTLLDMLKRWTTSKLSFVYFFEDKVWRTVERDNERNEAEEDVGIIWETRATNALFTRLTCLQIYEQFPADLLHVIGGVIRKVQLVLEALVTNQPGHPTICNRMRLYGNTTIGISKKDQRNTPISDLILSLPSAVPAVAMACTINVQNGKFNKNFVLVLKYVVLIVELLVCYTDPAPRALEGRIEQLLNNSDSIVRGLDALVRDEANDKSIITIKLIDFLHSLPVFLMSYGRSSRFSTTDFEAAHKQVKLDFVNHASGRTDSGGSLLQLNYYQHLFRFVGQEAVERNLELELVCALASEISVAKDHVWDANNLTALLKGGVEHALSTYFNDHTYMGKVTTGAIKQVISAIFADGRTVGGVGYEAKMKLVSKDKVFTFREDSVVCPRNTSARSHMLCFGESAPNTMDACQDPLCAVHRGFQLGASWKDCNTHRYALPIAFLSSSALGIVAFCIDLHEVVLEQTPARPLFNIYRSIGAFVEGRGNGLVPRYRLVPQSQFRGSRQFCGVSNMGLAFFYKFSTRALVAGL